MLKEKVTMIRDFFLFDNLSEQEYTRALELSQCTVREYASRDTVYSPTDFKRAIGLVLTGTLTVSKCHSGHTTVLNTLHSGDSFGAAGIFGDEDRYPTAVIAKTAASIAFISAEKLELLIREFPNIALNYIRFLSEKIRFLNDKVDSFTKPSVREKTVKFIISAVNTHGSCTIPIKNMKKTANSIGASRPSFYRVIEELSREGAISYENGSLTVLDMARLTNTEKK